MFHSNQEMMLRKRLEQEADWQEALELQSRRLMDLQLLDLKNHNLYNQSVPVRSPGMLHIASEGSLCSVDSLKFELFLGIPMNDDQTYFLM